MLWPQRPFSLADAQLQTILIGHTCIIKPWHDSSADLMIWPQQEVDGLAAGQQGLAMVAEVLAFAGCTAERPHQGFDGRCPLQPQHLAYLTLNRCAGPASCRGAGIVSRCCGCKCRYVVACMAMARSLRQTCGRQVRSDSAAQCPPDFKQSHRVCPRQEVDDFATGR